MNILEAVLFVHTYRCIAVVVKVRDDVLNMAYGQLMLILIKFSRDMFFQKPAHKTLTTLLLDSAKVKEKHSDVDDKEALFREYVH